MKLKKWMIIPLALFVVLSGVGIVMLVHAQQERALLKKFDLSASNVEEMVEKLETVDEQLLKASVNNQFVVLSDGNNTAKVKMPEDKFFLAFAPYINESKPCSEYNLNTCEGELANQTFQVSLVNSSDEVILQQEMTSTDKGFLTLWLDKDMEATLVVTYNGLKASAFISTYEDSNTCITTLLQLKK